MGETDCVSKKSRVSVEGVSSVVVLGWVYGCDLKKKDNRQTKGKWFMKRILDKI